MHWERYYPKAFQSQPLEEIQYLGIWGSCIFPISLFRSSFSDYLKVRWKQTFEGKGGVQAPRMRKSCLKNVQKCCKGRDPGTKNLLSTHHDQAALEATASFSSRSTF